jgi:predicted DNA-binding transcriptional regulator AlpA
MLSIRPLARQRRRRNESEDMSDVARRLISIPDARWELGGIGHTTIYDLIKRGELRKVNIGRRGFITSESLAAYVDRLTEAAAASA